MVVGVGGTVVVVVVVVGGTVVVVVVGSSESGGSVVVVVVVVVVGATVVVVVGGTVVEVVVGATVVVVVLVDPPTAGVAVGGGVMVTVAQAPACSSVPTSLMSWVRSRFSAVSSDVSVTAAWARRLGGVAAVLLGSLVGARGSIAVVDEVVGRHTEILLRHHAVRVQRRAGGERLGAAAAHERRARVQPAVDVLADGEPP